MSGRSSGRERVERVWRAEEVSWGREGPGRVRREGMDCKVDEGSEQTRESKRRTKKKREESGSKRSAERNERVASNRSKGRATR